MNSRRIAMKPATLRRMVDACVRALRVFAGTPGASVHSPAAAWRSLSDTAQMLATTPDAAVDEPADPLEAWQYELDGEHTVDLRDAIRKLRVSFELSSGQALVSASGTDDAGAPLLVRPSGDGWVVVRGTAGPVRCAVTPDGQMHDASYEALKKRDPRNSVFDVLDPVATVQKPPPPPEVLNPPPPKWVGELQELQAKDKDVWSHLDDVVAKLPAMEAELASWNQALAQLAEAAKNRLLEAAKAKLVEAGEAPPTKAAAPPAEVFCPDCGAKYRGAVKFCTGCGKPRKTTH